MKNHIKRASMFVSALLTAWVFASSAFVQAAGSLSATIEPATGTWVADSAQVLDLFGTASGANTSGFSFTVVLSNLTIDRFDSTGTVFDLVSVTGGGSAGSTSVSLFAGYSGVKSASGKQFVGKLYVKAGSAGQATARTQSVDAYDGDLEPMAGSGVTRTYTVSAPATPTNPSPSTPTTGNNPNNTSTVPKPTNEGTTTETIPESSVQEILETEDPLSIVSDAEEKVETQAATDNSLRRKIMYGLFGLGSLVVLLTLTIVGRNILRTRRASARHMPKLPEAPNAISGPMDSSPPQVSPAPSTGPAHQGEQIVQPTNPNPPEQPPSHQS